MAKDQTDWAQSTLMIENDRVRITKWQFKQSGDRTDRHRHDHDYVIVPLTDGDVEVDTGGGDLARASMVAGEPYFRDNGVEHDVISVNTNLFSFLEIEPLR